MKKLQNNSVELRDLRKEIDLEKESLDEKNALIQVLTDDLSNTRIEKDSKQDKITEYEGRIKRTEDILTKEKELMSIAENELQKKERQLLSLQSAYESKTKSLSHVIYKLNQKISLFPSLEAKVSDLTIKIREKDDSIVALQEIVKENKDNIFDLNSKLNKSNNEADTLKKHTQELSQQLERSNADLEESREALLSAAYALEKFKKEIDKNKLLIKGLTSTINSNKSEIETLATSSNQLKYKIQHLEDINEDLSIQMLQYELLRNTITECYASIKDLKLTLRKYKSRLREYEQREQDYIIKIQRSYSILQAVINML